MMRKLQVLLSFVLVIVMSLTFCSCSDDAVENGNKVWYLGGSNLFSEEVDPKTFFEGVADSVNPTSIYSSLEYTTSILCGSYILNDIEKDVKDVRNKIPFVDVAFENGSFNISTLPVAVHLGKEYFTNSRINYRYSEYDAVTDNEVAVLEFATKEDIGYVVCTYEINKNTIKFKNIEKTSGDNEPFKYKFTGVEFEYNFALCGPNLTLSKGDDSLKLTAFAFSENTEEELYLTGYSLPDSPLIDELDYFTSSEIFNYAVKRDGSYYDLSAFKITEDGKFTIYLEDGNITNNKTTVVKQYAYVVQGAADSFLNNFKILLLDGEKQYYYTDDVTMREARVLKDQGIETEDLSEEEIKEIAEKKTDLFKDLQKAFEEEGISVTVNHSSGEIAIDASVLFGGDSAEISAGGKELLNKFLKAYTSIIYNEKYDGFISKTMVEGHTAPIEGSTYESGLELSQERADNVKEYCLSSSTGVDTSKLASALEAVGLSNSKPVYDSNGEIDKEACRRVSFKFIVKV